MLTVQEDHHLQAVALLAPCACSIAGKGESGKQLKGLIGKQVKEQVGVVLTEVAVAPGVMKRAAVGPMQPACPNRL